MGSGNLKILVFSNYLPHATVAYALKALQDIGNEVILAGPEKGYDGNYIQMEPDGDALQIFKKVEDANLCLYIETNTGTRFLPKNIEKLPLRTGFWAIDNHLNFRWHKEFSPLFDFVFFAQPSLIPWALKFGIRPFPLPLACDPEIHREYPGVEKKYDIVFVGKLNKRRKEFFTFLKNSCPEISIGIFSGIYLEDMARAYSQGRAGFNLPVRKDINMRTFEIPACGLLLFTPELKDLGSILPKGSYVPYKSTRDIPGHLRSFIKDPQNYYDIARRGAEIVSRDHTYKIRMQKLIDIMMNENPRRKNNVTLHLSLLFFHSSFRNPKSSWNYFKSALRRRPLFTIFYCLKYFWYYLIEAIRKNTETWPY